MHETGRRRGHALGVTLLVAMTVTMGACGADGDDGASSSRGSDVAVRIGAILSTSGPYSQLGAEAQLALDGFADVWRFSDGRRIEFEVINDGSDPTQAAAAAQTFGEEGVAAIIGPSAGATMTAAFPVLSQLGIPVMIGPPIPYPNFNEEPFIFSPNIPQVTTVQREDFEDYLEDRGRTDAVQLSSDDASGQASAEAWGAAGYATRIVPLDVTSYQPVLAELQAAGHDALLTFTAGGQPPAHVARAREALGWEVDQYLTPANLNADYIELAGEAAEGSLGFLWPAGAGSGYFVPFDNHFLLPPAATGRGIIDVRLAGDLEAPRRQRRTARRVCAWRWRTSLAVSAATLPVRGPAQLWL